MNIDLQADLDKFLKEKLDPINKQMVEQENIRHKQFLEKHFEKYNSLGEKHDSHISQLITLEGVILGIVIVFTNSQQVTIWLILAVCLILFSLIFGIWSQSIGIQANYQSHEWDYYQELKNHWFTRELWKDETVKTEKQIIEPNIPDKEIAYKKTLTYKILKFFHLNADRIENIFKLSFVLALFIMILHLLSKAPVLLN
jgi:hypothetical protein